MSSFAALAKAAQTQQAATIAQQKAAEEAQARKADSARKAEEQRRKDIAALRAKQLEAIEREKQKLEAKRLEREQAERERGSEFKEKQDLKKRLNGSSRGAESPKPSAERVSAGGSRARSSTPVGLTLEERRRAIFERQTRDASHRKSGIRTTKSVRGLGDGDVRVVTDPHAVSLSTSTSVSDGLTARQRLAMLPVTLTKLNTEKRDLRGPLEIQMELQKQRAAAGEGDPVGFREEKKREEMVRRERAMKAKQERLMREMSGMKKVLSEDEAGREVGESDEERKDVEKPKEKERPKEKDKDKHHDGSREGDKDKDKERPKDLPLTAQKPNGAPRASLAVGTSSPRPRDKPLTSVAPPRPASASQSSSVTTKSFLVSASTSKTVVDGPSKPQRPADTKRTAVSSSAIQSTKRKRTPSDEYTSEEEDRHYKKQSRADDRGRARHRRDSDAGLHGETRRALDDVLSMFRRGGQQRDQRWSDDDDDMEATGEDLWREEKASERLARLEDEREAAEEAKHEAEKRRKRLQMMKGGK
ncbi:hypothetical protein DACRYDRAFT_114250 [Dacryopinax primogenitus]|uniref:SPT2-domain-containing protein n=1 Tax=Dacryopinax primogenitus (strain DJM 731) TaxID=1858805 RepID=M5G3W5_DACPD|nr:uncharacterized protein DACRYDRAFT_114250 [Dacryopinax primogenitus]EJU04941.1 hypothetical protein DACRYDRAFT_114250 [Dacryopinax primogenitus]